MANKRRFMVIGEVKIFPVVNPWIYVNVPKEYTEMTTSSANRGLVPVKVRLGGSVWDTSLMPKGDGTHFIPLKSKVRKSENISVGDNVKLYFTIRKE